MDPSTGPGSPAWRKADRAPTIDAIIDTFTVLAFLFVGLRMYTRLKVVKNVGPEDWLIIAAFVMSVLVCSSIHFGMLHGAGRHYDTLSATQIMHSLQGLYASLVVYQLALTLVKASILYQYKRLFVTRGITRAINILQAINVIVGVGNVMVNLFTCTPVPRFWDKTIPGSCLSEVGIWFSNAALNIATDLAILVLPMPVLKHLQLPKRQKYGVMGVFALGGFGCLVSVLRLYSLYINSISTDYTWDVGPAAYWSSIEVNVGIICATLPTLKALVSRWRPSLLGNSSGGRTIMTDPKPATTRTHVPETRDDLEMGLSLNAKTWTDDISSSDPLKIKVVTVLQQARSDLDESPSGDGDSDSDRGAQAHGPITTTAAAVGDVDTSGGSAK